jgi:3-oxoacyl-[acyl-carrier protein] reductase
VLITGASGGLGSHLARSFWSAGWNLALVGRNRQSLLDLSNSLPKKANQSAPVFACDLSLSDDVIKLSQQIKEYLPRLDVLINNAAIHGPIGPLIGSNLTYWDDAIRVNLLAPVALCHGLIGFIASSGGGSIINLSGGGATGPRANFTAYASAKAALVRFSETLAQEVSMQNIRVNCIAPGAMKTSLIKEVIDSGVRVAGIHEFETANKVLEEGGASFDAVADLALFLSSEISRGISGKLISAIWDNWREWPHHLKQLQASDVYTLRRITGRERDIAWGDN